MSKKKNTEDTNTEVMYIDPEFLAEHDSSSYVASTMLSRIFIPSQKVPREITDRYRDSDSIQRQLLAESPISEVKIHKPYWSKGSNKREFDSVHVEIFGAICLTGDRHCLDCIIAHGGLIHTTGEKPLTLRQATELCGLDVDWARYNDQSRIDRPLKNTGVYFHIQVSTLLKAMGVARTKPNRESTLMRLKRLSLMHLHLTFEKDGEKIPNRNRIFTLIDKEFHLLLNRNIIRNKAGLSDDTFTDLIICVDDFYLSSLREDGQISRERFLNDYPHLLGPNQWIDFAKFLDSNTRNFLHGKFLSELIFRYYEEKIDTYGMNLYEKSTALMNLSVLKKQKLLKHFEIVLQADENPNKKIRGQDYRLLWLPKMEGRV